MKRRYEFKARLWQSISVVALCSAFTLITAGCGQVFHQPKHTGPVTVNAVIEHGSYEAYQFMRPNREIFVMHFSSNAGPFLLEGAELADLLYEDDGRDIRVFVKALLRAGSPIAAITPAPDSVYGSAPFTTGWTYQCLNIDGAKQTITGNRDCTHSNRP